MESEEAPRVRGLALAAALVAMVELALALWAAWIALSVGGACPASGGAFSCEAIFRPKLASLMGIPIAKVGLIGAIASLAAAVLLAKAKPSGGFARATAFGALAGAAFAIGVQPLSWIGAGAVCPVCLGIVTCAFIFAALATSIAIKMKKDVLLAILFALAITGLVSTVSWQEGHRLRDNDQAALRQIDASRVDGVGMVPLSRWKDGRDHLLLFERAGCPYCRSVKVDVMADERFHVACESAGVAAIFVEDQGQAGHYGLRVEHVPTLVLLRDYKELGRVEGYYPDLDPYLELIEKARAR
jgi:uncharacterized membrane protein